MERTGVLLESGIYCGHYYGTPLPLSNASSLINYSKLIDETDNCKINLNGNPSETNLINISINKDLLSSVDQLSIAKTNQQSNNQTDSLQQAPAQLSAMALKRRRNRSNNSAIDANALPRGWECIRDDYVHGIYYIDHINKVTF